MTDKAGGVSGAIDSFTAMLHEVHGMASDTGSMTALAILLIACIFCPQIGVFTTVARLIKEDRQDSRKQAVELQRLKNRLQGRPKPPPKAVSRSPKQPQLPKPPEGE